MWARARIFSKAPAALCLVVFGALIGGGIVWARGNQSQISACVEPRTNYLKFGSSCGGQQLTWNTEGPQGPKGDARTGWAAGGKVRPVPRGNRASAVPPVVPAGRGRRAIRTCSRCGSLGAISP